LAKENIRFIIEGEGEIIGDANINANPRAVEWSSAPVLIRSTKQAGKIKIKAEVQFPGIHAPAPAELEIESVPYDVPMCYQESSVSKDARASRDSRQSRESSPLPSLTQRKISFCKR
jgi:beta-galactosidase